MRSQISDAAAQMHVSASPSDEIIRAVGRRRRQFGLAAAAVFAVAGGVGAYAVSADGTTQVPPAASFGHRDPSKLPTTEAGSNAPGPVSATVQMDVLLKYSYPTVATLARAPQTDAVVVGTVAEVQYSTSVDGDARTTYTVDVVQKFRGSVGSTVVVNEDGGYLPASQVIAEAREKAPAATPTLDPNSFVEVRFEGAPHPQAGQKVLLFLMKDPNRGHEGEYMGVMSAFSRFTLGSDSLYHRASTSDGMEGTAALSALQKIDY